MLAQGLQIIAVAFVAEPAAVAVQQVQRRHHARRARRQRDAAVAGDHGGDALADLGAMAPSDSMARSSWVWASMKPGASTRPRASTSARRARRPGRPRGRCGRHRRPRRPRNAARPCRRRSRRPGSTGHGWRTCGFLDSHHSRQFLDRRHSRQSRPLGAARIRLRRSAAALGKRAALRGPHFPIFQNKVTGASSTPDSFCCRLPESGTAPTAPPRPRRWPASGSARRSACARRCRRPWRISGAGPRSRARPASPPRPCGRWPPAWCCRTDRRWWPGCCRWKRCSSRRRPAISDCPAATPRSASPWPSSPP